MLSLAHALLSIAAGAAGLVAAEPGAAPGEGTATGAPTFSAEARAVSNWRGEALADLAPAPLALAAALGAERPIVTRCVKLNNYWCIKSARWNGEIGADDEGHTGFASAERGADAAVKLLRRYYLELDRKSALDIVRRWAPAECRVAGASGAPAALALRGLGNTLRARWLAAQAKPAKTRTAAAGAITAAPPKPAPRRVSAVPLRPLPTFTVPSIMVGMAPRRPVATAALPARVPPRRQPTAASVAAAKAAAARPAAPRATRVASLVAAPTAAAAVPSDAIAPPPAPPPSGAACGSDEQRIQNYAARMVEGLGLAPGDDLNLFAPDGQPQPNLARVLLAMSGVELGYLRASVALVEDAIARATPPRDAGPGSSGSGL